MFWVNPYPHQSDSWDIFWQIFHYLICLISSDETFSEVTLHDRISQFSSWVCVSTASQHYTSESSSNHHITNPCHYFQNDILHCHFIICIRTVALLPGIEWHSFFHMEYHQSNGTMKSPPWRLFSEPWAIFLQRYKELPCWNMVHQIYFLPVSVCLHCYCKTVLQSSVCVLDCLQQWWVLASSNFWHQEKWERSSLYLDLFYRPWLPLQGPTPHW